jgi:general secretion pathway protein G
MASIRNRFNHSGRSRGFTLIELMVVLVILGMLAGLVGPRLFGKVDSSKVKTAETQIKMLRGALQTYRLDIGNYPSTSEGLNALMQPPAAAAQYWQGPSLDDQLPLDPWRTPYRYEHPVNNLQGFALYSLGADTEPGGEGINAEVGYLPQ